MLHEWKPESCETRTDGMEDNDAGLLVQNLKHRITHVDNAVFLFLHSM